MTLPTSYQITLPNTCALAHGADGIQYICGSTPGARIFVGAGFDTFEAFETPEEAAARAIEIDPSFDTFGILGPIELTAVNVTESPLQVADGADVTLNAEYSAPGDATITYQWFYKEIELSGATSSSISLSNVTEKVAGAYSCKVSAVNSKNQSGLAYPTVFVEILNLPVFS